MFIQICHGDGKIQLVNPVCRTAVLLEYVRKCCGCPQEIAIDLADEVGNPKNLPSCLNSYASDILVARSTFIPVRMDKDDDGQIVYTPLLDDPQYRVQTSPAADYASTRPVQGFRKPILSPRNRDRQMANGRAVSPAAVERKPRSGGQGVVVRATFGHQQSVSTSSSTHSGSSKHRRKGDIESSGVL